MKRYWYSSSITEFRLQSSKEILGTLVANSEFSVEQDQRDAWIEEIRILTEVLAEHEGTIYLEYSIPRMGKRIDAVILIAGTVFVLEFKIGERQVTIEAVNQAWDYALDLKNFHETSHDRRIAPVVIATDCKVHDAAQTLLAGDDGVLVPLACNAQTLSFTLNQILNGAVEIQLDPLKWENGRYSPTPTIIEAAIALYKGHSVHDISRSDASAINLRETSDAISEIIRQSRDNCEKSICFVTGVPGAGKTLVGLNVATTHIDQSNSLYSVFLSGNGPLVKILREALARDKVKSEKERGRTIRKGTAMSEVKAFIQNVHNFRDECLIDELPPPEHVTLFDEAQRAWDLRQTAFFMQRKKKIAHFNRSEPDFLISCLDRHPDWAVMVCLVGGGQEINTGEAGISEWIECLKRSYPHWRIYISSRLTESEYGAGKILTELEGRQRLTVKDELHLSVSMRSFRAENVSLLVKQLLDLDAATARNTLNTLLSKYPIAITRDLVKAKQWLRQHARGSERYGIVVSSQAERLKPHAIDVRSPMDPVHWFLDGPEDVRSSYFLEDVATEFDVQGLELDWGCVTWDADFRFSKGEWEHWSFRGDRWVHIRDLHRKRYLKNTYRVLLTRSRQGMVLVVPPGERSDPTRIPEYYDPTFEYLCSIGFPTI